MARFRMKLGGALAVGAAVAVSGSGTHAYGALMLTLSETGFAPQTFVDSSNLGEISFFGTYGDFQTNFVAGISDKLTTPSPAVATLQVQSLNVKNVSTAGTTKSLTITLTDDGYTFPATTGAAVQLDSSLGGSMTGATAGDGVTFQSRVVSPAVTTGLQTYTSTANDPGTTSFSTNVVPVVFTRPSAYTLTNTTVVSLTGANEQANLSGTTTVSTAVPEPATITGVAALGIAVAGRRARRR